MKLLNDVKFKAIDWTNNQPCFGKLQLRCRKTCNKIDENVEKNINPHGYIVGIENEEGFFHIVNPNTVEILK